METALGSLQGVLLRTAEEVEKVERQRAAGEGGEAAAEQQRLLSSRERTAAVFRAKELRLVQAQGAITAPVVRLRAEPL